MFTDGPSWRFRPRHCKSWFGLGLRSLPPRHIRELKSQVSNMADSGMLRALCSVKRERIDLPFPGRGTHVLH